MKNHAITAAAVLLALLTVLGERLGLLIAFAWHQATTPTPAPTQSPPQLAPRAARIRRRWVGRRSG